MTSIRALASAGSRLTIVLLVTVTLAGSATATPATPPQANRDRVVDVAAPAARGAVERALRVTLAVPATLTDEFDLRAGPVDVPLELRVPSLGITAPVAGVGLTAADVMDAPMGPADDPVWQQAFWYRGSATPGTQSTALIAGHIDDPLGRGAVFAHIDELQPGDEIVVHDTRNGLDVRFAVTLSTTYSLDEAADPEVLQQIYGAGPIAGTTPQLSVDGLSHLTLITCAGTFSRSYGTHDQRLVVFATRIG